MNLLNLFLLDASATGDNPGGILGNYSSIILMVVLVLIFWLFFIRPQSKRQKEVQKKREALGNGDRVVTAGGIHGTIREVGDSYFMLEIDKNVQIRVEKTSVYAAVEDKAAVGK